jgi:hypothetical protein
MKARATFFRRNRILASKFKKGVLYRCVKDLNNGFIGDLVWKQDKVQEAYNLRPKYGKQIIFRNGKICRDYSFNKDYSFIKMPRNSIVVGKIEIPSKVYCFYTTYKRFKRIFKNA